MRGREFEPNNPLDQDSLQQNPETWNFQPSYDESYYPHTPAPSQREGALSQENKVLHYLSLEDMMQNPSLAPELRVDPLWDILYHRASFSAPDTFVPTTSALATTTSAPITFFWATPTFPVICPPDSVTSISAPAISTGTSTFALIAEPITPFYRSEVTTLYTNLQESPSEPRFMSDTYSQSYTDCPSPLPQPPRAQHHQASSLKRKTMQEDRASSSSQPLTSELAVGFFRPQPTQISSSAAQTSLRATTPRSAGTIVPPAAVASISNTSAAPLFRQTKSSRFSAAQSRPSLSSEAGALLDRSKTETELLDNILKLNETDLVSYFKWCTPERKKRRNSPIGALSQLQILLKLSEDLDAFKTYFVSCINTIDEEHLDFINTLKSCFSGERKRFHLNWSNKTCLDLVKEREKQILNSRSTDKRQTPNTSLSQFLSSFARQMSMPQQNFVFASSSQPATEDSAEKPNTPSTSNS